MIALLLQVALGAISSDRVPVMPWATEELNFNLYSGYLNLTNTNGIKIHYVFAES